MSVNILVSIILILLSLVFRKSKLIGGMFFLFMWSLWGLNTWNGDYEGYENIFYNSTFLDFEFSYDFGYSLISSTFRLLGLEFQEYLAVISALVLLVVYRFGVRNTRYNALFACGFFFIFMLEYVFIRNFIAHIICLLVLEQYLNNKKDKKYIILILLASTIHSSSIVFLIFVLVSENLNLSLRRLIVLTISFIIGVIISLQTLALILGGTYLSRFKIYSENSTSLRISLLHLIFVCSIIFYFKILEHKENNNFSDVKKINILSLIYLGFYYYIPYFSRSLKFLFLIDYVFILQVLSMGSLQRKFLKNLVVLCYIGFLAYYVFYTSLMKYTLIPLFNCNLLWGDNLILHKL